MAGADPDEAQLTEVKIHRLFGEACGNRLYRVLVDTLLDTYVPVRALFSRPFADPPKAARRIEPVVRAVIGGDPRKAHRAATRYLTETESLMLGVDSDHDLP
jgi:GntR family transcriptional repressor for pyruvate dehydrogenase complex